MIKLTDILKELEEGKQVGYLYHFTGWNNVYNILNKGIKFSHDNSDLDYLNGKFYISTTRHPNFNFDKSMGFYLKSTRIQLDGNNISNQYKIIPINVDNIWDKKWGGGASNSSKKYGLFEERIYSSVQKYLEVKYILKVDVILKRIPGFALDEFEEQIEQYKNSFPNIPINVVENFDK